MAPASNLSTRTVVRTLLAAGLLIPLAHVASAAVMPKGEKLAKGSNCFSCHAVDHKVVGPAFDAIAKRYANQASKVLPTLVHKVKVGGAGNWGSIPMAPHPDLSDSDIRSMVEWVLSLNGSPKKPAKTAAAKTYQYKADGKTVTLDFPVFLKGQRPKVTDSVFKGYEQFDSYCFRCHGEDATGSAYAPNLMNSLQSGMTWQQFLNTAMVGRESKGMPSWAGFFSEKELRQIYEYVKARSVGLVPTGRPASAQD